MALQFVGCDIVVFVDNESALASMVKVGASNSFMCAAALVAANLELEKDKKIWFKRSLVIPILLTILREENCVAFHM